MKYLLLFIPFFLSCSGNTNSFFDDVNSKINKRKTYKKELAHIKSFAKTNSYNQDIALMIDYSLHSGKNRFFVIDLKSDSIIYKAMVCHGSCKDEQYNETKTATTFSNKSGSLCSSLGMSVIAQRAYSSWGSHYKYWIDGLEETNKNMRKRVVVLHSWEGVPDEESFPKPLAMSWGCPTVSLDFLAYLDEIFKNNDRVLLYSF